MVAATPFPFLSSFYLYISLDRSKYLVCEPLLGRGGLCGRREIFGLDTLTHFIIAFLPSYKANQPTKLPPHPQIHTRAYKLSGGIHAQESAAPQLSLADRLKVSSSRITSALGPDSDDSEGEMIQTLASRVGARDKVCLIPIFGWRYAYEHRHVGVL